MTDLTPIQSSMFKGHAYDPNKREMTVELNSGKRYIHSDVPAEKYEAFIGNASPGGYYNRKIKGNHTARPA